MKKIFILFFLILPSLKLIQAEDGLVLENDTSKDMSKDNAKVVYKYKQYEKFDFEDLSIAGDMGSPGDLSVSSRYEKDFKNKMPYRKNFNPEIHASIERVR